MRLYSHMNLHQEAVRLALSVSVELAQACLEPVTNPIDGERDTVLLRKLHRMIVLHMLKAGGGSSASVAKCVQRCPCCRLRRLHSALLAIIAELWRKCAAAAC